MNSLVKVFSNFKEFYSEINAATLTGAIDVVVVEQPDGEFQCSPFHVRFGKLGVLRSREKVVDIEINGEPVDIHMKLGDSGEAFFVEECAEEDVEELPENLATSPIPSDYFPNYGDDSIDNKEIVKDTEKLRNASDEIQLPLPLPRRNSIDFSKEVVKEEIEQTFENQVSDFTHRRHTDNAVERRDLSVKIKEYTTQKLRQEWAEHEEMFQLDQLDKNVDWSNSTFKAEELQPLTKNDGQIIESEPIPAAMVDETLTTSVQEQTKNDSNKDTLLIDSKDTEETDLKAVSSKNGNASLKDDSKGGKKRRRKKSQMKKKNAQRKGSSSSSMGSATQIENNEIETDTVSLNNNTNSSNDESPTKTDEILLKNDIISKDNNKQPQKIIAGSVSHRMHDLDIHFFSDTEIVSPRTSSRPPTPIQSDSELEITRDKETIGENDGASWKWGELPTQNENQKESAQGLQRNSVLSGMFSFMKKTNKIRKTSTDAGVYLSELDAESMDPEMAALYFPSIKDNSIMYNEDDRESGNGTSLPHSPSSMEGQKSLDSDFDDGKLLSTTKDNKYLDFVAMSLCGGNDNTEPPSDEEFDKHIIKFSDVCQNPNLFSSPNLVVRLNGKYYSWSAACPIVMTIITFQQPLPDDAIEQLMNVSKTDESNNKSINLLASNQASTKRNYSWWYWRRGGGANGTGAIVDSNEPKNNDGKDTIDADQNAVATQTSRTNTPDISDNTISKTEDSTLNAETASAMLDNDDLLHNSVNAYPKNEKYKKSLRLSSDAIKQLNLKPGINEIEFSVTTAYQGTSRCKCYLFRWKHSDKVVISDIDGTITKSDVLGHILPMVGKDWAQLGVAQLFSKIEENGYKLLYLSARAIGQSRATREYLRSIRQGDVKLPDGPLLLNPTSLISAFHREVIERKPEQFKIACLSDISALFPDNNPFYAGYGNRINDVWAYRAVGIPIMRIFTINTKGELKHELTQTFQSSYSSMTYIVDQLFPPIKYDEGSIEFSNFNYWRDPLPEIELDIRLTNINSATSSLQSKTLSTIPENKGV